MRGEEPVGDASTLQLFRIMRCLCDESERMSLLPNANLLLDPEHHHQQWMGENRNGSNVLVKCIWNPTRKSSIGQEMDGGGADEQLLRISIYIT